MSKHYKTTDLLKFAFPTIIMMIFVNIYGVVDALFVSNIEGDTAFSGMNLILPYVMLLGTFGYMFGTGGSALISKTYGEGDIKRGNRYFTMLIETLAVIGIICAIVGYFTIKPVSQLFGATQEMLDYCIDYGTIIVIFLPFFIIQNAFQSYMVLANKPNLGFIFCLIAGLTNTLFDFILIYICRLGVIGASIATGISQVVGAILPVSYIILFKNKNQLKFEKTKYEIKPVVDAATNGLSEMVANVSMSLVNILFNAQLMQYIGQNGVTAYGIIMYVGFLFTGVYFGYSVGVAPIIGFQYGAKNNKELQSLLKKSLLIYVGFGIVCASSIIGLARILASAFIRNNEELLNLSTLALRLYSIGYYFSGFNIFLSSFFTDLNDGFVSGVISLLRTLVFQIIAIYVMPLLCGINGLWLSIVVAEILSLFVSFGFLFIKNKQYHYFKEKELVQENQV